MIVGKTVESVKWNEYHDGEIQSIRFIDGTTLLIEDRGYGHTVKLLNDRALAQIARQQEVRDDRWRCRTEDQKRFHAIREARIARAKALLTRKAFDKWRRKHYPTTNEILKDVWVKPIRDALNQPSILARLAS